MTTPTTTTTAPTGSGAAPAGAGTAARLRNGELRRMVAQHLAQDPGAALTPGRIAAELGRSSGAVGNALATLATRGQAQQVGTNPVTYQATDATRDAATAAATTRQTAAPAARPQPTGAAGPAIVTGPVRRPNGQMYHPRKLSGLSDVTALRRLREAGVPALMYGPPGTGKTSVVEAAFDDLITVPGDSDTVTDDFVGSYTQTPDGRYEFAYGPLVTAMREGRALFIDDATLIPPTVLAVVYPAMDGRRQIILKTHKNEVIDAEPGFYVVAGHNPGVHGAVLTDALSSRFAAQIHVSTDYDLAAQLKIDNKAVRVARNLAARLEKGEIGWAPQLRELIAFNRIAEVLGTAAAAGNLVGIAPEADRDVVAETVRNVFGADVAPLSLGPQF
ncbi:MULTISPECIES: AAA family ATPase [Prauserella salsuginis group]|uniref:AAA family ATPase n=1 Tax=Prauserella salsuginis TaxID=387889 RepID=A0ABW6FZY0_9PSEU|nr:MULTISPECIES: AAA family ATPase [Prauserella salsuginis group]MCR3721126.1 AAA domain (dynein-related subfamily) [Prauserella flava]MCR3734794.1 AAA domain (dynein-related subfamily) [Prauserella salsuginis]